MTIPIRPIRREEPIRRGRGAQNQALMAIQDRAVEEAWKFLAKPTSSNQEKAINILITAGWTTVAAGAFIANAIEKMS